MNTNPRLIWTVAKHRLVVSEFGLDLYRILWDGQATHMGFLGIEDLRAEANATVELLART